MQTGSGAHAAAERARWRGCSLLFSPVVVLSCAGPSPHLWQHNALRVDQTLLAQHVHEQLGRQPGCGGDALQGDRIERNADQGAE